MLYSYIYMLINTLSKKNKYFKFNIFDDNLIIFLSVNDYNYYF
jgi:hypothetical protein